MVGRMYEHNNPLKCLRSQLNHIPYLLLKTLDVTRAKKKKKEKYREKKDCPKMCFSILDCCKVLRSGENVLCVLTSKFLNQPLVIITAPFYSSPCVYTQCLLLRQLHLKGL